MIIFVWVFGVGGVFANFMIYQQTSRKKLLLNKLIADCLWTLHYISLGAVSGAFVCAIGILREFVFLNKRKKWAQGKRWLMLFLLLSILSAVLTWKNGFSVLPTIASILSVFSFWKGDPTWTKILSFPISVCFMTYNIFSLSYAGIINEVLVLISTAIGIIRIKPVSIKTINKT
ncbi:MAG: YgjV family protein [Clostridia bacterium]|nr:YgjV family protein [Clostridia bacterium]